MWTELAHYFFLLLGISLFFRKIPILRILPYLMVVIHLNLTFSFIVDDYSTLLVWNHSHEAQPIGFKIAALWSNYEGALFLLLTFITYYTWILKDGYNPKVFLGSIGIYFLILELIANPFLKQGLEFKEGLDTNPLLQSPFLLIHPPILYFGYGGLLFPFLIGSHYLTSNSFSYSSFKKSSYLSWTFLTLGIGLGSWWAFHELGWGGYWYWDPVETLAVIPWTLTLISLHVIKNKSLTLQFAFLSFLSAILGNFLLRSGLLNSLHSFTQNSTRTWYLILPLFLILIYGFKLISKLDLNSQISLKYLKWNLLLSWKKRLSSIIVGILIIGSCYSLKGNQTFSTITYLEFLLPLILCSLLLILILGLIPKEPLRIPYENIGYINGYCLGYGLIPTLESSKIFIIVCSLILTLQIRHFFTSTNKKRVIGHFGFVLLILMISLNNYLREEILLFFQIGEKVTFHPYQFLLFQIEEKEELLKNSYQLTYNILNENLEVIGKSQLQTIYYQLEDLISKKATVLTNGLTDLKLYGGNKTIQISKEPALFGLWISILILTISGLIF